MSHRAAFAKHLLATKHTPREAEPNLAARAQVYAEQITTTPEVGIIGAGVAGLYAALLLNTVGITSEILEAHPSRIGGRVFTYHFSDAKFDYIDIGAMRFPVIHVMKPLIGEPDESDKTKLKGGLIAYLNKFLKAVDKPEIKLIEYILSAPNTLEYFNGIHKISNGSESTAKELGFTQEGGVPESFGQYTASDIINPLQGPFKQALRGNFEEGFKNLMKHDHHSTRSFLQNHALVPSYLEGSYRADVINWLEAVGSATGLFDQAWSETIFDSLDFDYYGDLSQDPADPGKYNVDWKCVEGGTSLIIDAMEDVISKDGTKILLGQRVTQISPSTAHPGDVRVTIGPASREVYKEYNNVISTLPLGALAGVDTSACEFSYKKRTAIRSLQYDHSCKIAIRFKTRWWENPTFMNGATIKGGVSSTDLPIRKIVYPSYGDASSSGVMIISYTWAQDASRISALIAGKASSRFQRKSAGEVNQADAQDVEIEEELVRLCIDNLAKVHNIEPKRLYEQFYYTDESFPLIKRYFCFDWYHSPYSCGAFALFGPSQFTELYPDMIAPAMNGRLHFSGEALSAHHAWIVGSLNSAYRNVLAIIAQKPNAAELKAKLVSVWPVPDELDPYQNQPRPAIAHTKKAQDADQALKTPKVRCINPSRM